MNPGLDRSFYLPRLPQEYYQGDAVIHWTLTLHNRTTGWLDSAFHLRFREMLLHASGREHLLSPTYCLMPDHMHLVWMGCKPDSDQLNAIRFLRKYISPFLRPHKFQRQPQDHVLRQKDRQRGAFARLCDYIRLNPARAELIEGTEVWPFWGAVLPGYPDVDPGLDEFWPLLWRLYAKLKHPMAGEIVRPPWSNR
jgi:REP element-mobilizing transposase RayT